MRTRKDQSASLIAGKEKTMTVTEISSHSHVQDTDSSSERQISGSTVRDAFTDLAQALQSGDLQGAQQAFETIQSARNAHINNTQTVTIGNSSLRDALLTRAQVPRSDALQTAYKTGLILLHPTVIDQYYWQAEGRFMVVDHPYPSEPSVLRQLPPDGVRYGSRAMAIEKAWETANKILQQEGVTPGKTTRLIWDEQFKMFGPRA
jgi:hypothetical protein